MVMGKENIDVWLPKRILSNVLPPLRHQMSSSNSAISRLQESFAEEAEDLLLTFCRVVQVLSIRDVIRLPGATCKDTRMSRT